MKVNADWNRDAFNKWMNTADAKASKNLTKAIRKIAFKILRDAKVKAPVRTGALRASGRVVKINAFTSEVIFGGGGTGVNYAAAVEYGGHRPPKPYLRPAVAKNKRFAEQEIVKVMKDTV